MSLEEEPGQEKEKDADYDALKYETLFMRKEEHPPLHTVSHYHHHDFIMKPFLCGHSFTTDSPPMTFPTHH